MLLEIGFFIKGKINKQKQTNKQTNETKQNKTKQNKTKTKQKPKQYIYQNCIKPGLSQLKFVALMAIFIIFLII